jgi:hypothetical protein
MPTIGGRCKCLLPFSDTNPRGTVTVGDCETRVPVHLYNLKETF